jgi:hypothetical protein
MKIKFKESTILYSAIVFLIVAIIAVASLPAKYVDYKEGFLIKKETGEIIMNDAEKHKRREADDLRYNGLWEYKNGKMQSITK